MQIITEIKDGKTAHPQRIVSVLKLFEGKKVKITIDEFKKTRSKNQNAFYWGVVIPIVHKMFMDNGENLDHDEVHEYLKQHVGKLTRAVVDLNGETVVVQCSSKKLFTDGFENYMTQVRIWAAGNGVIIPLPNE